MFDRLGFAAPSEAFNARAAGLRPGHGTDSGHDWRRDPCGLRSPGAQQLRIGNGKAPVPCPHYHSHYYGTVMTDPDGHTIEAVCHPPEA